jgi:hypothetical protein
MVYEPKPFLAIFRTIARSISSNYFPQRGGYGVILLSKVWLVNYPSSLPWVKHHDLGFLKESTLMM